MRIVESCVLKEIPVNVERSVITGELLGLRCWTKAKSEPTTNLLVGSKTLLYHLHTAPSKDVPAHMLNDEQTTMQPFMPLRACLLEGPGLKVTPS